MCFSVGCLLVVELLSYSQIVSHTVFVLQLCLLDSAHHFEPVKSAPVPAILAFQTVYKHSKADKLRYMLWELLIVSMLL